MFIIRSLHIHFLSFIVFFPSHNIVIIMFSIYAWYFLPLQNEKERERERKKVFKRSLCDALSAMTRTREGLNSRMRRRWLVQSINAFPYITHYSQRNREKKEFKHSIYTERVTELSDEGKFIIDCLNLLLLFLLFHNFLSPHFSCSCSYDIHR